MTTEPVIYRVGQNEYPTTGDSGELAAEQGETVPYPSGSPRRASMGVSSWPPPGFSAPGSSSNTVRTLQANLPTPEDIAWVQGDTALFSWILGGVFWTSTDPQFVPEVGDPTPPTWVEVDWAAQVRNPYIASTYRADYWVPAYGLQYEWWRAHSLIGEFTVATDAISLPATTTTPVLYGTLLTITLDPAVSAAILPGVYRFDVQGVEVETGNKRTRIGGRARVVTEWTLA